MANESRALSSQSGDIREVMVTMPGSRLDNDQIKMRTDLFHMCSRLWSPALDLVLHSTLRSILITPRGTITCFLSGVPNWSLT